MIDAISEAIAANQLEAAAYSRGVRVWMMIMGAAFFSAVIFASWRPGARWILSAAVLNVAGLILIKATWPELGRTEIGTSIHLVYWTFVLFMVWRPAARADRKRPTAGPSERAYSAWLVAVSAIMLTSLALDLRTAAGWLL